MSTKHANVYHGASARLKQNPAQLIALVPKSRLHSIHGVAEGRVFCSLLLSLLCSMSWQIHGERAYKLFTFVSSSGSSETLLGLAIASPLPNELYS